MTDYQEVLEKCFVKFIDYLASIDDEQEMIAEASNILGEFYREELVLASITTRRLTIEKK